MYCKHRDTHAAPFESYSYCPSRDVCQKDVWNYVNQWCYDSWKSGYTLDLITDCNGQLVKGPDFTSNSMFD